MSMKPIIFSTPMVRAILKGRKTQTRRAAKPHLPNHVISSVKHGNVMNLPGKHWIVNYENSITSYVDMVKPRYQLGDILWVRETWERLDCSCCEGDSHTGDCTLEPDEFEGCYVYKGSHYITGDARWRPSIHMPRAAARIFLRVTDVRVERVQEISVSDALAEGIRTERSLDPCDPVMRYKDLWDTLNAKRGYGWDSNPWVWIYTFERVNEDGTPCAP